MTSILAGVPALAVLALACAGACCAADDLDFPEEHPTWKPGLPRECLIQQGQQVLMFGDSIVAPGMYSYVANSLLDQLYAKHDITFRSAGWAGCSAKTILPHVPEALQGKKYDWVIIALGHNDVGQYSADEFKVHAARLLEEIRKLSDAKLAWMSLLGDEPSPYADELSEAERTAVEQKRARQKEYARATKEFCEAQGIVYLPMSETFELILQERERKERTVRGYCLAFTYDGVHPNLPGYWVLGGALLQCLGLHPPTVGVETLPGECMSDRGRRQVEPLTKLVLLHFESVFAQPWLLPAAHEVPCPLREGIVVDGALEDWGDVKPVRMDAPSNATMELAPRSSSRYVAAMRTCRDAQNLYFAFAVREPDVSEGTWFPEIIELIVDARKDTSQSGNVWQKTPGLTQFCFHRDFTGKAGESCAKVMVNGDATQGEGIRAVARKTAGGYVMEVAIPVSNFKQVELKEGASVPFDWAVSFTDQACNLDLMGLMGRCSTTRGYASLVLK